MEEKWGVSLGSKSCDLEALLNLREEIKNPSVNSSVQRATLLRFPNSRSYMFLPCTHMKRCVSRWRCCLATVHEYSIQMA